MSIKLKNKYKGIFCCLEDNREGVWALIKNNNRHCGGALHVPTTHSQVMSEEAHTLAHMSRTLRDRSPPQTTSPLLKENLGTSQGPTFSQGEFLPLVKEKVLEHLRQLLPESLAATYNLSQEGGDWLNSCSLTCFLGRVVSPGLLATVPFPLICLSCPPQVPPFYSGPGSTCPVLEVLKSQYVKLIC